MSNYWIKLRSWEYWPWYLVYIPVYFYWLWCGIKARSFLYISAVNPGFEYGGIVGASKMKILQGIPGKYVPKSILFNPSMTKEQVKSAFSDAGLSFPVIAKPDVGERGFKVELIQNESRLYNQLSYYRGQVILQEYIDLPVELGIFYYRYPNEPSGTISSVVEKGFLKVIGDGKSTIKELMLKSDRARLQVKRLEKGTSVDLEQVPEAQQVVHLEPIGNHVRGTTFNDGNRLINDDLVTMFDKISSQIKGFYYGRFDIRCKNRASLYKGDFKILELNGAASEPAHIYSPGFPIIKGYGVLFHHWKTLYQISRINHQNGVAYMTIKEARIALKKSRFRKA